MPAYIFSTECQRHYVLDLECRSTSWFRNRYEPQHSGPIRRLFDENGRSLSLWKGVEILGISQPVLKFEVSLP